MLKFNEMEEDSAEFIMANHMVINSKVLQGKKECIRNLETILLMIVKLLADKTKKLSTADKFYLYFQMRSHKNALKTCIEQKEDVEAFHEMMEETVRQLNAEEEAAKADEAKRSESIAK